MDKTDNVDTASVRVAKPAREQGTKDYAAFAAAIKDKRPIKRALMAAGYAEAQASKGMATVMKSEPLQRALLSIGVDYSKIGEKLDADHITKAITGKLYTGMLTGDESGINATKMLGQLRTVGAFQNENLIQAVIIQAPDRPVAQIEKPDEPKMLEE
jgi:hypothetical protein